MHPLCFRYFSHVGRERISLLNPSLIELTEIPHLYTKRPQHKCTRIETILKIEGPLGVNSFPIHHGLKLEKYPEYLKVIKDEDECEKFNKHQLKFVMSMWGTTTRILKHSIFGVIEVKNA